MVSFKRIVVFSLLALHLNACSTYPSKFRCPETKGLGCTMLSEIDRKIDNGEIEEIYGGCCHECRGGKNRKCKKGKCNYPKVKSSNWHKVKKNNDQELDEYEDQDYWYFK